MATIAWYLHHLDETSTGFTPLYITTFSDERGFFFRAIDLSAWRFDARPVVRVDRDRRRDWGGISRWSTRKRTALSPLTATYTLNGLDGSLPTDQQSLSNLLRGTIVEHLVTPRTCIILRWAVECAHNGGNRVPSPAGLTEYLIQRKDKLGDAFTHLSLPILATIVSNRDPQIRPQSLSFDFCPPRNPTATLWRASPKSSRDRITTRQLISRYIKYLEIRVKLAENNVYHNNVSPRTMNHKDLSESRTFFAKADFFRPNLRNIVVEMKPRTNGTMRNIRDLLNQRSDSSTFPQSIMYFNSREATSSA